MSETTEKILDTTPNKKWSLVAVTKKTCSQSSLSFRITNGTITERPTLRRVNRQWVVTYNSPQVIPGYVRLFVAKYFAHWFSPMRLP
jgi:hypothetical protein